MLKKKKKKSRGWDVARWHSTCLACARPWVQSQHQKRQKKKSQEGAGGMAQVVECLPSKHKALNLNPSTTKKKK
jgi:hypothetical protein